jgi:YebC/PmpR family DNA-binding regulatory protein
MAGHSKWANIQHRKGKQDAKRGKIFTKLAREITVAAKMGGPDPDANPRLRAAIVAARKESMPNDNIKRAVDKGSGTGDAGNIEEIVYEGYGPSGVAFIVEAVTDKKTRTTPEIRSLFSKHGGNMGEAGSVAWQFEKKGYIQVAKAGRDEEAVTELVLEIEADDYEETSDTLWGILTPADQLHAIREKLEAMDVEVESAKLEMIPTNEIEVSGDDLKSVLTLMEKFDDHDDVQNVWNNADFDLSELEA